ncbi:copper chaperone PCu(A)C [Maribius pontilimi]|uniref:Copper chaperone PCu(A)C n=1 Tax=Palleronia pontilimi TaxID=1964209 RepID=A0A934M9D1_9RHOB|nr:copper chaperone PCu(A)C [Palleronia pontilimi]MBJ3762407.1 copper chaperone PCu(A)C [Palleronia pontilimi]
MTAMFTRIRTPLTPTLVLLGLGLANIAAAAPNAAAVTVGDLTVTGAHARATLPGQPVGGGYMTVTNAGDTDDRLVAVSSPVAGRAELHEMRMDGDVMRMRPLPDGLPVPAGETITLEPGGPHLMFMDLAGPLVAGEIAPVRLTFERAGAVDVPFAIAAPGQRETTGMHH